MRWTCQPILAIHAVGEVAPLAAAVGGPRTTDRGFMAPYLSVRYAAAEVTTRAIALVAHRIDDLARTIRPRLS